MNFGACHASTNLFVAEKCTLLPKSEAERLRHEVGNHETRYFFFWKPYKLFEDLFSATVLYTLVVFFAFLVPKRMRWKGGASKPMTCTESWPAVDRFSVGCCSGKLWPNPLSDDVTFPYYQEPPRAQNHWRISDDQNESDFWWLTQWSNDLEVFKLHSWIHGSALLPQFPLWNKSLWWSPSFVKPKTANLLEKGRTNLLIEDNPSLMANLSNRNIAWFQTVFEKRTTTNF